MKTFEFRYEIFSIEDGTLLDVLHAQTFEAWSYDEASENAEEEASILCDDYEEEHGVEVDFDLHLVDVH